MRDRIRTFYPSLITDEDRSYVQACRQRAEFWPRINECYHNAQKILLFGDQDLRMSYAEGLTDGKPHGWLLLDDEEKVIDITWAPQALGLRIFVPRPVRERHGLSPATSSRMVSRAFAIGKSPPPSNYLGVQFSTQQVWDLMVARRGIGPLLSAAEQDALERRVRG